MIEFLECTTLDEQTHSSIVEQMGRWFMSGIMIQTSAGEDGWHDRGKMLILHPDKRTSAGRAVAGETPAAMRRFDCPRVRPASSAARGIARRGCGIPSRVVTSMAEWNAKRVLTGLDWTHHFT